MLKTLRHENIVVLKEAFKRYVFFIFRQFLFKIRTTSWKELGSVNMKRLARYSIRKTDSHLVLPFSFQI